MRKLSLAVILIVLSVMSGCSADDPTGPGSANVRLMLTDAPLDMATVSAVNVTLSEFLLYPADSAESGEEERGIIMEMPGAGEETLNLLDYRDGATVLVASAEVPAGDYQRIRMVISAAELVHDDDGDPETPDIAEPIFLPSGKVDIPIPFSIVEGEGLEITVDFDAEGSVKVNATPGNHPYILRPVVTPVGMRRI